MFVIAGRRRGEKGPVDEALPQGAAEAAACDAASFEDYASHEIIADNECVCEKHEALEIVSDNKCIFVEPERPNVITDNTCAEGIFRLYNRTSISTHTHLFLLSHNVVSFALTIIIAAIRPTAVSNESGEIV